MDRIGARFLRIDRRILCVTAFTVTKTIVSGYTPGSFTAVLLLYNELVQPYSVVRGYCLYQVDATG